MLLRLQERLNATNVPLVVVNPKKVPPPALIVQLEGMAM
jgi:hypothetical protein